MFVRVVLASFQPYLPNSAAVLLNMQPFVNHIWLCVSRVLNVLNAAGSAMNIRAFKMLHHLSAPAIFWAASASGADLDPILGVCAKETATANVALRGFRKGFLTGSDRSP